MTTTGSRIDTYRPRAKVDPLPDYEQVLDDLSSASVHRNFDPYLDIAWDAPEMTIVPDDPRWILSYTVDPIGRSTWYQSLPESEQIRVGMWRMANIAKVGLQFESILIRGLLQYSDRLRNGDKRFRYTTHEAKEECNHTLMFQEYVNRIGAETKGMRRWMRMLSPIIPLFSTLTPTVFFFGVLAGEEPIDHMQKQFLRADKESPLHPTTSAVMELHVAEEARHISFAHNHLRTTIPTKGRLTKFALSIAMPIMMRILCDGIVVPPNEFRKKFNVPSEVMKETFWESDQSQVFLSGVFADVRMLAEQCGLMNPASRRVWRALGIDGRMSRFRSEPAHTAV